MRLRGSAKQDGTGKKHASFCPVCAGGSICMNLLMQLWVCDKHQHLKPPFTPPPQALPVPLFFINSYLAHRLETFLLLQSWHSNQLVVENKAVRTG